MTRTTACPDGSDLLALAAEGVAAPAVRAHVDACRPCLRKLRRLKAEVVHLRAVGEAKAPPSSTDVAVRAEMWTQLFDSGFGKDGKASDVPSPAGRGWPEGPGEGRRTR